MTRREKFFICFILSICVFSLNIHCEEHEDEDSETEPEESTIEVVYVTPKIPPNAYLFETFDEISNFENKWVKSRAKKDDVDENIAKYDGLWAVEQAEKDPLTNDFGLVLKSKAKHAAISVLLTKPYVFKDKPFVVQYEVNLQNGQECGGAYIKLLSKTDNGFKLEKFNDKTPYTLMFGPDKCGNDHKLHFIFRHVNPLTKEIEEKHCKKPKDKVEEPFKDKNPHLYTLILRPDNSFEVLLDHQVINSGHLLEDFTPPVNPAREIDDPNDIKPADWDEREKIADPSAVKPDDWDESAPRQIVDQFAMKPDDWLEDAPELLPDPEAVKPDDWDDEMDGEWEAPLVPNPKCEGISGCGPWKPPMIDNPDYKGKWKAPMIDNPNYKGKWTPRRIHNPDFFEDLEPFKMTTITAVGLELWSMSDNIYFDNILITDNIDEAQQVAAETFDLKLAKLNRGQTTLWGKIRKFTNDSPWMWLSYTLYCTVPISCIIVYLLKKVYEKGIISQAIDFSNKHPWIYGVYVLALAIPVVLVFLCCCAEDVKEDKEALRKKTDEPTADDPVKDEEEIRRSDNENVSEEKGDEEIEDEEEEEEEEEAEVEAEEEEEAARMEEENEAKAESEENEDKEKSESDGEKSQEETRTSPRLRKVRKE